MLASTHRSMKSQMAVLGQFINRELDAGLRTQIRESERHGRACDKLKMLPKPALSTRLLFRSS